jgi:hypothetical protein
MTSGSAAARAASVEKEPERITIDPAREHPLFDVDALRWLLAAEAERGPIAPRVALRGGVQAERSADYFKVVEDAGGTELTLHLARERSIGGLSLRIASGQSLAVDIVRERSLPLLMTALTALGRSKRLVVHHSPYMEAPALAELRGQAFATTDDLELSAEERVFAESFTFSISSSRRIVIAPRAWGHPFMPATLDWLLAAHDSPRYRELRVAHSEVPLAPWVDWCRRTKGTIVFAREWTAPVFTRLKWDGGVVVELSSRVAGWERWTKALSDLPTKSLKRLAVTNGNEPPPALLAEGERVAEVLELLDAPP